MLILINLGSHYSNVDKPEYFHEIENLELLVHFNI